MIEKYINRYKEMKTNLGKKSLLASKIQERNIQLHIIFLVGNLSILNYMIGGGNT